MSFEIFAFYGKFSIWHSIAIFTAICKVCFRMTMEFTYKKRRFLNALVLTS